MGDEILLNTENNDLLTTLNGQTVRVLDDGGLVSNYSNSSTFSLKFSFDTKYQAVLLINTELSYDFLGIFNGSYDNMVLNSGVASKFTSNGAEVSTDNLRLLESGVKQTILIFEPGDIITVTLGADNFTNRSGIDLSFIPYDGVIDGFTFEGIDSLQPDIPNEIGFKNCTFEGRITGVDFTGFVFNICTFRGDFVQNNFSSSTFTDCDFGEAVLDGITVNESTAWDDDCDMTGVKGLGIIGTTEFLPSFLQIKYGHLFGKGVSHKGVIFGSLDLQGLSFENNDLSGANLSLVTLGNNESGGIIDGDAFISSFITSQNFAEDGTELANLFGIAVSLSSDGTILAISDTSFPTTNEYGGKVKVYQLINNDSWERIGSDIVLDENLFGDQFGNSIDLSSDGTILAIGAKQYNGPNGFAQIYQYTNGDWEQMGQTIVGEDARDEFGYSVSLSGNGKRIVVGARKNDPPSAEDEATSVVDAGHLRVYELINNVWTQVGEDIDGSIASDRFGNFTSISNDGTIVVGGTRLSRGGKISAFIEVDGNWTPYGNILDKTGRVGISGDGKIMIKQNLIDDTDFVETFQFDGSDWNPLGSSINAGSLSSLSLTKDGLKLLVSFIDPLDSSTKAKLYEWNGSDWQESSEFILDFEGKRNDLSNAGNILVFGNSSEGSVQTFINKETNLPQGYIILNGVLMYAPFNDICFDPSEIVETDQGNVKIKYIDVDTNTIRGKPILKLTQTRCMESKMVLMQKDRLGKNIPNKDTKMSLNHKVWYNGKMVRAKYLPRGNGIKLIDSEHRILHNIMLAKHTYMKVNNMKVETLRPMK